ncbi:MAG: GAF domain-containing sensor histidine kinase [Myxococcales bacterium]|nr:GAF domain-containing sensor histidine kinase [Myxococcales bacterium]
MRRWQDTADPLNGIAYAGDPGALGAAIPITELVQAHDALQAVTDALATSHGFDEIVPTVLTIVAKTFGVEAVAYFEHTGDAGDLVFLRYWMYEGRVLRAEELLAADPTTPRRWVDGFTVPSAYPVAMRSHTVPAAVVIDHAAGTAAREFDEWGRVHGWALELNVPCMIRGVARGSLVLCRAAGMSYTSAEIALAEALAKQLALAVEADRLSREVRERAIEVALARERANTLDTRTAELARAHSALQAVTDALATSHGFDEIVPAVLRILGRTFNARATAYFERGGSDGQTVYMRYCLHEGRILRPTELLALDPTMPRRWLDGFAVPQGLPFGDTARARAELGALIIDHAAGTAVPELDVWLCTNGCPLQLNVPCSVGGVARGSLVVCREPDAPYTNAEVALTEAIGNQLALAVEADRLGREVRDAAVAKAVAGERQRAADVRAAELARANAALRGTAQQLAGARDLGQFLEQTLAVISSELRADTAVVFTYDPDAEEFTQSAFVVHGVPATSDPAARMPVVIPRDQMPFLDRVPDAAEGYAMFDIDRDHPLFWPWAPDPLVGHELTTALVLPIQIAGRVLGQVRAGYRVRPSLTPEQLEMTEALANQAAVAIELTRLAHEARAAAVARERNALAREVHDTLAQGFSGIVMQLGAARAQLGTAASASPALARVERLAREHLAEARRSIAALRPEQADIGSGVARPPATRGLDEELRRAVSAARDAHGAAPGATAEIEVDIHGTPRRLPADVELELLRVAQAALANALRHGHARTVRVDLAFTTPTETGDERGMSPTVPNGGVRITIADDGRGFDPDAAHPGRFGLVGMSERANRVGAALTVVTAPGEGTEVVVMWRQRPETA